MTPINAQQAGSATAPRRGARGTTQSAVWPDCVGVVPLIREPD